MQQGGYRPQAAPYQQPYYAQPAPAYDPYGQQAQPAYSYPPQQVCLAHHFQRLKKGYDMKLLQSSVKEALSQMAVSFWHPL